MPLTATVLEIQRMSTEDGPGLRTTVFLKGCSLRCAWCHNPESIPLDPQLVWKSVACIGCRSCVDACPRQARELTPTGARVDRDRCEICGTCEQECPAAAIEVLGKRWTVDDLVAELLKDRAYFEGSDGGGVTVSGGEPALQAGFVSELLARLGDLGVHTALDTCGACGPGPLLELAARADLVLFDLKHVDSRRHRELTGQPNERIFDNARRLAGLGTPLWIRTPLIPGATATQDNLRGIGRLVAELGGAVVRWELCAFNNLCQDQYRRLDLPWPYADTPQLTDAELAGLAAVARTSGVDPDLVRATGPTRREP